MRLTTYTDYSLRVLIYLGVQSEKLVTIKQISEHYGISNNHLLKVVHQLGLLGFIETVRGRNGGLRLARPASQIVIGDVVRKMEQDMALVECFAAEGRIDPSSDCKIMDACVLKGALARLCRHSSTCSTSTPWPNWWRRETAWRILLLVEQA